MSRVIWNQANKTLWKAKITRCITEGDWDAISFPDLSPNQRMVEGYYLKNRLLLCPDYSDDTERTIQRLFGPRDSEVYSRVYPSSPRLLYELDNGLIAVNHLSTPLLFHYTNLVPHLHPCWASDFPQPPASQIIQSILHILDELIMRGEDINGCDQMGETVLHYHIGMIYTEDLGNDTSMDIILQLIPEFLQRGADPCLANKEGVTAYQLCSTLPPGLSSAVIAMMEPFC